MDSQLREKIKFEISQIDALFDKAKILEEKCKLQEPDFIEISAVGSTLHSYYNGLENIFVLIAKQIDNASLSSQRWHKEILDSMFIQTSARNAVLNESLHESLLDYLSFRHVFRHSYGYALDWERLSPLFFSVFENWKSVKTNLQEFIQ